MATTPIKPQAKPIDSSNIGAINYDPASKVLQVTFKNNKVYTYSNVEAHTVNEFSKSESKGKFLHKNIKPYHPVLQKSPSTATKKK
jgi:hypothetical protein